MERSKVIGIILLKGISKLWHLPLFLLLGHYEMNTSTAPHAPCHNVQPCHRLKATGSSNSEIMSKLNLSSFKLIFLGIVTTES